MDNLWVIRQSQAAASADFHFYQRPYKAFYSFSAWVIDRQPVQSTLHEMARLTKNLDNKKTVLAIVAVSRLSLFFYNLAAMYYLIFNLNHFPLE